MRAGPAGRALGLLLLLLLAAALEPASTAVASVQRAAARADSADLREEASDAQIAFERLRRRHLPETWAGPPAPCDERVGRFCFWHEDPEELYEPPPDPLEVTVARNELLEILERAAERIPGDGWIAGQRVRYLVEAGRPGGAVRAIAECRAERWWCRALLGYARHAASDHAAAEAAFEEALAAMPTEVRRAWTDLALVLEGDARERWEVLEAPGARRSFARRVWWLADPLWSVPGGERRSEHLARHVIDRLQRRARSPYAVRWGDDLGELLIRYGWPAGFERVRQDHLSIARGRDPSIVAHHASGGRGFVPGWEAIGAPTLARRAAFSVDRERPRATWAPPFADRFVDLEHQLALFRRGERAVVVAGFALEPDSVAADAPVEAALVVAAGPDAPPEIARSMEAGPAAAIADTVPWAPAVVSVEALARREGLAGRARYGLPIRTGSERAAAVSDLLLLDRAEPLPGSLDEAAPRARPTTRVGSGEAVGVYFEIDPPAGAERAEITLAVRDERGGFWHGLGSALGLVEQAGGGAGLSWVETVAADAGPIPRTLAVELPRLPEGRYALELTVDFGEAGTVVRRRGIEVR
ncbi:MAG: hypothetical protein R3199_07500 [Gemmatimonadota bacterium]|nr:hypothetical protein [Gemmatimonadota bacterium]